TRDVPRARPGGYSASTDRRWRGTSASPACVLAVGRTRICLPAPSPVYGGRLGWGPGPKAGGIHCRARFAPTPALPRKRGRELSALSRQRTELSAVPRERWKGWSVLSCMREGVICSFPRLRGKVGMGAGTEGGGASTAAPALPPPQPSPASGGGSCLPFPVRRG